MADLKKRKKKVMNCDVLFVLFDASSIGLFHVYSSFPKKIFLLLFIHKNIFDFFKGFIQILILIKK